MTVREILRILHKDGWREVEGRNRGSHVQLRHPTKKGKVTVSEQIGRASCRERV